MTKKTPKPTPAHMQKLADLMDTRPEGVTTLQVQNALQVSPTLAKAALIEIGAVEQDGKWVFAEQDDATLEEIGNFVSQPKVDWSKAPEGATHWHEGEWIRWTGHKDMNLWNLDAWDDGCRWTLSAYGFHGTLEDFLADGAIPRPTSTAIPELKKLTQAVFDGLPVEYRWAFVCPEGEGWIFESEPKPLDSDFDEWDYRCNGKYKHLGGGYDTTEWRNSKIERLSETCIDEMGIANFQKECQRAADQQAKSDFAVALEAERQRVYDAVAIGGTVERLAELTGLHVDDVQQHLDALIVDGAIFREPIIIGYGHKVAV